MSYPLHVQTLIDSLSTDQARFQRRCIALCTGLQVLVGFSLFLSAAGAIIGLYMIEHPLPVTFQAALAADLGQNAAHVAYLAIAATAGSIGLYTCRAA